jgi:hypothetical protein
MSAFQLRFKWGAIAERKISRFAMACGYVVLPVYEIETEQGHKGPRAFTIHAEYRAADVVVFSARGVSFVETKAKACFTWHFKTKTWQTGCDVACYEDYLKLRRGSHVPLWLFFLHESALPSPKDLRYGCPQKAPTGLFGGEIERLATCVDHTDTGDRNNSTSGMVYWRHESLQLIADVETVNRAIEHGHIVPHWQRGAMDDIFKESAEGAAR